MRNHLRRLFPAFFLVCQAMPVFAGPPTDQGFWTFFKEGVKDDMVLIGLGMRAGLRVFIPGYSQIEDMIEKGYDTETALDAGGELAAASANQLKDIVKDPSHPLYKKAHKLMKAKNIKPRNLTASSKKLFKVANALGWLVAGYATYEEIQEATLLALEYQKGREAEYAQMRSRADSVPKTPEEPPQPEEEPHPCIPCWTGDLVGECTDPNCPNYGNPHKDYKGGGMPAFGRPAGKPKTSPPPKPAPEPSSDALDWTGKPIPKSDLDAINSLNDF